jgi:hypothetical protein
VVFGLLTLIVISIVSAFAAGVTVPPSNVDMVTISVTLDDIEPFECHGITLTQIISGSGILTGTDGNDLILGSSGADIIDGRGGNDCILGGGDDALTGGDGSDICVGGPGTDTFNTCEGEIQ